MQYKHTSHFENHNDDGMHTMRLEPTNRFIMTYVRWSFFFGLTSYDNATLNTKYLSLMDGCISASKASKWCSRHECKLSYLVSNSQYLHCNHCSWIADSLILAEPSPYFDLIFVVTHVLEMDHDQGTYKSVTIRSHHFSQYSLSYIFCLFFL